MFFQSDDPTTFDWLQGQLFYQPDDSTALDLLQGQLFYQTLDNSRGRVVFDKVTPMYRDNVLKCRICKHGLKNEFKRGFFCSNCGNCESWNTVFLRTKHEKRTSTTRRKVHGSGKANSSFPANHAKSRGT